MLNGHALLPIGRPRNRRDLRVRARNREVRFWVGPNSLNWTLPRHPAPIRCRRDPSKCAYRLPRHRIEDAVSPSACCARNFPTDVFSAVLPVPKRSNDAPTRTVQSFQQGMQGPHQNVAPERIDLPERFLRRVAVEVVVAAAVSERQPIERPFVLGEQSEIRLQDVLPDVRRVAGRRRVRSRRHQLTLL